MLTRVRVVPVVMGDASVYVVERRNAGGGDGGGGGGGGGGASGVGSAGSDNDCNSGCYLVATDVRRLASLKEFSILLPNCGAFDAHRSRENAALLGVAQLACCVAHGVRGRF
jgi:hypothetical protein